MKEYTFSDEHRAKISKARLATNADRTREMCEMAKQGKTNQQIAAYFDMTPQAVGKALRRRGLKTVRGPSHKKGIPTNPEKVAKICDMARQGKTPQEIAAYYGNNVTTIYAVLRREGVEWEHRTPNSNPEKVAAICEMFKSGMSVKEIAKHFGYKNGGTSRVSKFLTDRGLRTNKPSRKDGYAGDKHGYLHVKMKPDDPMISMADNRRYVFEHRLVLARKLGRPLLASESVHHIDGNRQNNSPDNLQIRQGKHGNGIAMCCADCGSQNVIPVALG